MAWEYYAGAVIVVCAIIIVFCSKGDGGSTPSADNGIPSNVALFPPSPPVMIMNEGSNEVNDPNGNNAEIRIIDQKEERRFHILTSVIHKKVVANVLPHENELSSRSLTNATEKENSEGTQKKENIQIEELRHFRSSRRLVDTATTSFYSAKECPICLDPYADNDDICWSRNENCCHAFHLSCMMDWLMDHDICPLCRCDYLQWHEDAEESV